MNYELEHRELVKYLNKRAERNPRLGMLLCILSMVFVLSFCVTFLLWG